MKSLLSIIIVFVLKTSLFSQQYFVEFIVDEINSVEKSKALELKLRSNADYEMVRMDHNTGRCFIIMKEEVVKRESFFDNKLKEFGYEISCFYMGQRGKDPFVDIKRGNCK